MIKLYSWIILFILGAIAQENAYRNVASTLRECYENKYLLEKDNRLPHTLNTLIAILQKIENAESTKELIDLRRLTLGIMHRFRQDGIEKNPTVLEQSGVLPYRTGAQAQKYLQILRFIPEKTSVSSTLSYDIITDIERCTLHFMLSSSIERFERGDEGTVCRYADYAYRKTRSVSSNHSTNTNVNILDDVETLTPEQIDDIVNKNEVTEVAIDPNALYPELPPNHPEIARFFSRPSISRCPVENGVIKTDWGSVSVGSLIAGIAAGLQPETVKLSDVFPDESPEKRSNLSKLFLDNKWIATVAGDLAEVVLIQGPTKDKLSVGVNGDWNSSYIPRWYFLNSHEKLQFTTAEIRGNLDGLIVANEIESLYSNVPTLRLSQILDMYYNAREGLFNSSIRACNRKKLFRRIAVDSTMSEQTYSASLVIERYLHKATMNDNVTERFAMQAANELSKYINSSMDKDLSCQDIETGNFNNFIQIAVDLTIILDTTWPFDSIQSIIAYILDNIKISQYNSQFTIMNAYDGSIMINTTSSILDFSYYNITSYMNITRGFNLAKSLDKLDVLQRKKLEEEKSDFGHAKSDVVLIIPYTSSLTDKEYCIAQIKKMREEVPDATLLILTYGSKDRWADLVISPTTDLFSTAAIGNMQETTSTIINLISRIKRVPQRLLNTQCGADYNPVGSTNPFIDYIEPGTFVSYQLHPNYFFSDNSDHVSLIKIEGSGWGNLKVCTSRQIININSTEDPSISCKSIDTDVHTVSFSCDEAPLIHLCQPLYLSVIANSSVTIQSQYHCTDTDLCRFPHMIKYTVSYENLLCVSGANINMLNVIVLIINMIYIFL